MSSSTTTRKDLYRKNAIPPVEQRKAGDRYLVKSSYNPNWVEQYTVGNDGQSLLAVGNVEMIDARFAELLTNNKLFHYADDIAAMNALIENFEGNNLILVEDASAHPEVNSGSALFGYKHADESITLIAEYESLNIVFTWGAILGKPSSSPAAIDTAVANSHTHQNKATLDKLGEDTGGNLTISQGGETRSIDTYAQCDW